jgi:hypothetical protein
VVNDRVGLATRQLPVIDKCGAGFICSKRLPVMTVYSLHQFTRRLDEIGVLVD